MAKVFASAGAFIGKAIFGTALAAKAGWLIGAAVGAYIFRPKFPDQEGPRLNDLSVTSSAYGSPITQLHGTMRMGGNIIWSSGISEVANVKKIKTGLFSSQKVTTYTYFTDFAVALCEGEVDALLKIYADNKLIYDNTGEGELTDIPGFRYRFYKGSETQEPDPLIANKLGLSLDNTPAYRGICYIVFERFPLEKFGNRVPNINVEITKVADKTYPRYAATLPSGWSWTRLTSPGDQDNFGYDPVRQTMYAHALDDLGQERFVAFSVPDMTIERSVVVDDMFNDARLQAIADAASVGGDTDINEMRELRRLAVSPFSGYIYSYGGGSDYGPIHIVNPDTLKALSFGRTGNAQGWDLTTESLGAPGATETSFEQVWYGHGFGGCYDELGMVHSVYFGIGFRGWLFALKDKSPISGSIGQPAMSEPIQLGFGVYNRSSSVATGRVELNGGDVYIATASVLSEDYIIISRAKFGIESEEGDTVEGEAGLRTSSIGGVTVQQWRVYNTDIGTTGGFSNVPRIAYDKVTNYAIVSAKGVVFAFDPVTESVVWYKSGGYYLPRDSVNESLDGYIYAFRHTTATPRYSYVYKIDCFTGNIDETIIQPEFDTSGGYTAWTQFTDHDVLDLKRRYAVGLMATNSVTPTYVPHLKYIGVAEGQGESLQSVLTDLCVKSGLEVSDLNFSNLDNATVRGYAISRVTNARNCIQQLAGAYFFDACESDYQIKFVTRGDPAVLTVDGEYLLMRNSDTGEALSETRQQDTELPLRISVVYPDTDREYEQNAQSKSRVSQPVQTMYSNKLASLEFPIVFNADEAKTIATKILYNTWSQRSTYDFNLPKRYLKLDPTDVVNIQMPSGNIYTARLDKFDIGSDYAISASAIEEDVAVYSLSETGDIGGGFVPQSIVGESPTQIAYMDLPLMSDADDPGITLSIGYVAATPIKTNLNWSGVNIFRSSEGLSWEAVISPTEKAGVGFTSTVLGPTDSPFTFDETNTLEVYVRGTTLASVTELEMLNGANLAAIEVPDFTNGVSNWEVINFQNVVDNGGGSYTLSRILRGRRGTEVFCNDHAQAGTNFVILDPDNVYDFFISASDIGVYKQYRSTGQGQLFEDGDIRNLKFNGNSLKPYAPVNITATLSSGNINLAWVRRTRVGGAWKDGTGTVSLSETSEAYEVDIYNGGVIVRTLTSTTPNVTYTSADIATDFGTTPDTLTLAVYQMSSTVGRGFSKQVTVEVN